MIEVANDWVEKYKPKKITDIIGNSKNVKSIMDWLKEYDINKDKFLKEKNKKGEKKKKKTDTFNFDKINDDESKNKDDENFGIVDDDNEYDNESFSKIKNNNNKKYSCATIIGNHGTGKTTLINTIVNDLKYNVEVMNMYNLISNKNINEKINKLLKGINIFDSFDIKNMNKKKVIIIDEVEMASTQIEKKFIEYLLKINEENWFLPIIFVSSNKHSKLITSLKKYTYTIWLNPPTNEELGFLFKKILKSENLKINKTEFENTIKLILKYSQNDYRRLIHILYDLYKTFDNKPLSSEDIEEYCKSTKEKNTDIDIYKCTAELMVNYNGFDDCTRKYSGERVILPLMIHQNHPIILDKAKKNCKDIINLSSEITESISTGDIIENYIYSEQNWDMHSVHCYYSIIKPSYKLSSLNIPYSAESIKYELNFPNDLNRTSIKNINKRNIIKANTYLSNMDINDFMYANALSKLLIEDKKNEECFRLYDGYDVKSDTLVSVLKIDKINIDKNQTQQNTKKLFSKYLDKKQ